MNKGSHHDDGSLFFSFVDLLRRKKMQRQNERIKVEEFLEHLSKRFGKIIFHIPHASTELPEEFFEGLESPFARGGKGTTELYLINLKMSDVLLLDLVKDPPYEKVVAPYSRLFCDVERYWNDIEETMSKHGMGAVYTKDYLGRALRRENKEHKAKVKKYYDRHHSSLLEAVKRTEGDVLLIDLHSFGPDIASVISKGPYPDICIGYNEGDENEELISEIERFCDANCLTHQRNFPDTGSMTVPNIQGTTVRSIMIEINNSVGMKYPDAVQ